MPYSFHIVPRIAQPLTAGGIPQAARLQINASILDDALKPARLGAALHAEDDTAAAPVVDKNLSVSGYSPEDVFEVICEPQAVFRVRSVGRCSSTLSGESRFPSSVFYRSGHHLTLPHSPGFPGHAQPILCCSLSPTGKYAATGSGDATARLWDMEIELPKATLSGHKGWVLCAEWEARERVLATGGHDGHVRFWDPQGAKAIGDARKGHTKWITSLSWEPIHLNAVSPRCASSSKDGTVKIWSTTRNHAEFTLAGHTASVNVVKWGGEGLIYTGSSDRTIKIWDSMTGKLVRTLSEHAHWVNTLALNTDFVLRTGPFDHHAKKPKDDAEGKPFPIGRTYIGCLTLWIPSRCTRLGPIQETHRHSTRDAHLRFRRPYPFPLAIATRQGPLGGRQRDQETDGAADRSSEAGESRRVQSGWAVYRQCRF